MNIAYFDEAGDDGFPSYSSPIFVLSAVYMDYLDWEHCFEGIRQFRAQLKARWAMPMKWEIHTKNFLLNKNPFRSLNIPATDRIGILSELCDLIGALEVRIVNVGIVKPRIRNVDYKVLDTAFSYSIQRVENDLNPTANPTARFMIISDEGRIGPMQRTARRIRRFNPIPSKFGPGLYRREIRTLIEDPLAKDSKRSYFIQMADTTASVAYLYCLLTSGTASLSNRAAQLISHKTVLDWMERLKPSLNLAASQADPYGVVMYPRPT